MTTRNSWLAMSITGLIIPGMAWAQHEAPQTTGAPAPSAELSQCVRVQPVIQNIITAATARAEAARLSNSPLELRAALDHLEAALRDIRAQSEPCATASTSSDPHAGHVMPSAQSPSSQVPPTAAPTQAPAATPDPHAGHVMPGATTAPKRAPTAKPAPPTTKPSPSSSKPVASDPHEAHAGHAAEPSGDTQNTRQPDPVNGLMVVPATAPKATYQGHTYYFSSEQSRKEFLENPAKFAKKPKE